MEWMGAAIGLDAVVLRCSLVADCSGKKVSAAAQVAIGLAMFLLVLATGCLATTVSISLAICLEGTDQILGYDTSKK